MPTQYAPSDRLLRLRLCAPDAPERELDVHFRVFDSPIARRWSDIVVFLSVRNAAIYNPERFYNFPNDHKTSPEWIHAELERCIDGVNRLTPGFVDIRPSLAMEQPILNELHERFAHGVEGLLQTDAVAKMCGSPEPLATRSELVRDPERFRKLRERFHAHCGRDLTTLNFEEMLDALDDHPKAGELLEAFFLSFEPETNYFYDMNVAIHRWEDLGVVRQHEARYGEVWKYLSVNYFPNRCARLRLEDYQHFTIQDVFGRVYLEDMTPGKCLFDIFRDGDEQIIDDHYKSLDYYWGDARIYFGPTHSDETTRGHLENFWSWFTESEQRLGEIGFRRDDPRMTIGAIPVADLEGRGPLAGLDRHEIVEAVSHHQRIASVAIVDENDTVVTESPFVDRFGGWRKTLAVFGHMPSQAGDY